MSKEERLHLLGQHYAKHIFDMDDELKDALKVEGGSKFWQAFSSGFKNGFKKTLAIATPVVSVLQPEAAPALIGLNALVNGGGKSDKKPKRKRQLSDKMKRRNVLLKKIMKEQNLKMIEASKFIKENNLEY